MRPHIVVGKYTFIHNACTFQSGDKKCDNDVITILLFCQVKQDTEEFRVMYREGPEGTPFHTLLVEGYVDGPLDVCKLYLFAELISLFFHVKCT